MGDVDAFVKWLEDSGTPAAHVAAHRHYAEELDKHPSLSAALRYHEDAGAPAGRLANLKATAAKRVEFEQSLIASIPRPRPLASEPVPYPPAEPAGYRPSEVPQLAIERPKPRTVEPNPRWSAPRNGCTCQKRYDLYLDNDFGGLAKMLGGGIGIGTFLLVRAIGVVGALAIAFGLAGLGGFATILTICFRCEGCRKPIKDLDDDERTTLRKGRAIVVLITVALFAGAALCAFIWITVVKSSVHHY